ncbi:uncharacterized protein LOC126792243 [Argentina anserina]|uniref:uncharacterized protein LOC126792243 n=1 Tax=Argentina anserina TaxID=57926 RepID=UPI002176848C|nr:uncharacterized protein LOC126792243 [Potentilla anserina]
MAETFQAASVAKLLEKLGVERFSVVGTSHGGFVAYHLARMWPEIVEKVVIASSGVNMRGRDSEALLKRADVYKIEELMLPATAAQLHKSIDIGRRLDREWRRRPINLLMRFFFHLALMDFDNNLRVTLNLSI